MSRIWTAAGGMTPLDPDSEQGKRTAYELTVVLLEVAREIDERKRAEALQQGAA